MEVASEACPSCGLAVAGGTEGCQRIFESIGLREYEDMRFARYHRIVVDLYAMQHPDRYGRSAKSFAAHLTGLCAWLENEERTPSVNAAVQRWLSGPSPIVRPMLPSSYGALTIRELVDEVDPVRYGEALRRWARATWDAYAPLHPIARTWIATALHSTRDSDRPGADPYGRCTSNVLNRGRTVSSSLTLR